MKIQIYQQRINFLQNIAIILVLCLIFSLLVIIYNSKTILQYQFKYKNIELYSQLNHQDTQIGTVRIKDQNDSILIDLKFNNILPKKQLEVIILKEYSFDQYNIEANIYNPTNSQSRYCSVQDGNHEIMLGDLGVITFEEQKKNEFTLKSSKLQISQLIGKPIAVILKQGKFFQLENCTDINTVQKKMLLAWGFLGISYQQLEKDIKKDNKQIHNIDENQLQIISKEQIDQNNKIKIQDKKNLIEINSNLTKNENIANQILIQSDNLIPQQEEKTNLYLNQTSKQQNRDQIYMIDPYKIQIQQQQNYLQNQNNTTSDDKIGQSKLINVNDGFNNQKVIISKQKNNQTQDYSKQIDQIQNQTIIITNQDQNSYKNMDQFINNDQQKNLKELQNNNNNNNLVNKINQNLSEQSSLQDQIKVKNLYGLVSEEIQPQLTQKLLQNIDINLKEKNNLEIKQNIFFPQELPQLIQQEDYTKQNQTVQEKLIIQQQINNTTVQQLQQTPQILFSSNIKEDVQNQTIISEQQIKKRQQLVDKLLNLNPENTKFYNKLTTQKLDQMLLNQQLMDQIDFKVQLQVLKKEKEKNLPNNAQQFEKEKLLSQNNIVQNNQQGNQIITSQQQNEKIFVFDKENQNQEKQNLDTDIGFNSQQNQTISKFTQEDKESNTLTNNQQGILFEPMVNEIILEKTQKAQQEIPKKLNEDTQLKSIIQEFDPIDINENQQNTQKLLKFTDQKSLEAKQRSIDQANIQNLQNQNFIPNQNEYQISSNQLLESNQSKMDQNLSVQSQQLIKTQESLIDDKDVDQKRENLKNIVQKSISQSLSNQFESDQIKNTIKAVKPEVDHQLDFKFKTLENSQENQFDTSKIYDPEIINDLESNIKKELNRQLIMRLKQIENQE